jgi:predicted nucleic acid-binding protein
MVLVDTSAWIEFFRRDGDPAVKLAMKALIEELEATLCRPVEMEFLGGAHTHECPRIQSSFDILPYLRNDQKIWREAATHYATLRREGITLPWNDDLIATLALHQNCRTYTPSTMTSKRWKSTWACGFTSLATTAAFSRKTKCIDSGLFHLAVFIRAPSGSCRRRRVTPMITRK